jgi:hypothetical protein
MSDDIEGGKLEMSPGLIKAIDELMKTGLDEAGAIRQLMTTSPEVFSGSPGDEVAKLLASWD